MLSFFLVSFTASFVGSILGLGGGFILVPALAYIVRVPFKDAVFLSLCSIFFLSTLKLLKHREQVRPHAKDFFLLTFLSGVGALTASYLVPHIHSRSLEIAFSLLLCAISVRMFLEKKGDELVQVPRKHKLAYPLFFTSGTLAGFFGIGGGILNIPILYRVLRHSMKEASVLNYFFIFLSCGVAVLVQFQTRRAQIEMLPALTIVFLLAGTYTGFRLSAFVKLSNNGLRLLFAVILFSIGLSRLILL